MSGNVPESYWRALFQFAQSVGSEDVVNNTPSSFQQISEADRKWLEEALSDYVKITDPVQQMKKQIEKLIQIDLCTPSENEQDLGAESLMVLEDLCSDIDCATALIRSNESLAQEFFEKDGLGCLIRTVQNCWDVADSGRFQAKAVFLLHSLASSSEHNRGLLHSAGISDLLAAILCGATNRNADSINYHSNLVEYTLKTLLALCNSEDSTGGGVERTNELKREELNLKTILKFYLEEINSRKNEGLQEQKTYAQSLLKLLQKGNDRFEETVTRSTSR